MRVSFGPFTLDDETRQLADGARVLHLSPKAFSLLALLVDRRPAVVEKGEIGSRIWPGVTVSEASLGGLVKEIRRALGDDARQPVYIRTVHSVGYAFIGDVHGVAAAPPPAVEECAHRCWLAWGDRTVTLAPGENVIGRDPSCAVWIDAAGVSRRHARITVAADAATIEDLGSRNGTAIGRTAIVAPRRLDDHDIIRVGTTALTFREWSRDRAPLTEPIGRRPRRTARPETHSAGE
jgi:DNA-binding winged helix-turn-helix (wHTH) protein